jgi:hypothetical protein
VDSIILRTTGQKNSTGDPFDEDTGGPQNLSAGISNETTEITRQDFDPVLDNLFIAREKILRDNLTGAFDAMNLASGELFKLNISLVASSPSDIQLYPLQKKIEQVRTSLLRSNGTLAIEYLNGADTQFIILSQELSALAGHNKDNSTQ